MKRWFSLLLVALLLLAAPGLAGQASKESFVGKWYQIDSQGEAWEIEFKADGTGTMSNSYQEIPLTWDATFLFPDSEPVLDVQADFGNGKMELLDLLIFKEGVLTSQDGRRFDRGKPDTVFLTPYKPAKFAPKSAFDGIWQMTGGLLTVAAPPISMELDMAELGLKPPVYIGIKEGRVFNSNQGATTTEDSGVISQYTGNAIYVGRPSLGITAALYYVAPDMLHARYIGPANELGVDVVFNLVKTDLTKMPLSDEAADQFPWEQFDPMTP